MPLSSKLFHSMIFPINQIICELLYTYSSVFANRLPAYFMIICFIITRSSYRSFHAMQTGQKFSKIPSAYFLYITAKLTKSGERPRPRSSRTLFCVGLVFCSPVELGYKVGGKNIYGKTIISNANNTIASNYDQLIIHEQLF